MDHITGSRKTSIDPRRSARAQRVRIAFLERDLWRALATGDARSEQLLVDLVAADERLWLLESTSCAGAAVRLAS